MKTTLRSMLSRIATAWWGSPPSFSSAATAASARASPSSFPPIGFSARFVRSIEAALAVLGCAAWSCAPSPGPPILPPPDGAGPGGELDAGCKTIAGAPPEVGVGQGQSDYFPLADLETVRVEAGPQ